jgi:DNA-binding CsgD family transcriptional regulator
LDIAAFIEQSSKANTVEELRLLFTEALDKICGFNRFVFTLGTDHWPIGLPAGHAIMSNYPIDWLQYYQENNFTLIDPIRIYGFRHHGPFTWSEVPQKMPLNRKQKQCLYGGIEAGLNNGVCIPLRGPYNQVAGVAAANDTRKGYNDPENLAKFNMLSQQFYWRFVEILKPQNDRMMSLPKLTDRERDVVAWVARGKNDAEISDVLKISRSYVKKIMEDVRVKYNTTTRTSATLIAIQSGELDVSDLLVHKGTIRKVV